jgi:hypothetical protein
VLICFSLGVGGVFWDEQLRFLLAFFSLLWDYCAIFQHQHHRALYPCAAAGLLYIFFQYIFFITSHFVLLSCLGDAGCRGGGTVNKRAPSLLPTTFLVSFYLYIYILLFTFYTLSSYITEERDGAFFGCVVRVF